VGSTPTRPTEEKKTYSSCMIYCKSFLVEKEGLFFIELMIQLAYTGKERSWNPIYSILLSMRKQCQRIYGPFTK
jgi:hypothetical protein